MTAPKRPIEGAPKFLVGTIVLTPSGRKARVVSHTGDGRANLAYVEAEDVQLHESLLRKAPRGN